MPMNRAMKMPAASQAASQKNKALIVNSKKMRHRALVRQAHKRGDRKTRVSRIENSGAHGALQALRGVLHDPSAASADLRA